MARRQRRFRNILTWRCERRVAERFREILREIHGAQKYGDPADHLKEQIRALPGYPMGGDPELDLIQIEIVKPIISTARSLQ